MAKAGVDNMFISRHGRGIFDWYSPDGSSVTTYSPGHYIDFYNILGKPNEEALRELAKQALIWSEGYNDIPGELTVMPAVLNFEFIWPIEPVENLDPFTQFWNMLEEVENEAGEKLQVRLPEIKFSTLDKFFTQIRNCHPLWGNAPMYGYTSTGRLITGLWTTADKQICCCLQLRNLQRPML